MIYTKHSLIQINIYNNHLFLFRVRDLRFFIPRLTAQPLTSISASVRINIRVWKILIAVWHTGQRACREDWRSSSSIVVTAGDNISSLSRLFVVNACNVDPLGVLNEHLSAHSGGKAKSSVLEVVVDDVDSSKADRGLTRVALGPAVTVVGDVEFAGVFRAVIVAVADLMIGNQTN